MIQPRVMISAQSSGSGKTTITCGILHALKRRGLDITSFKCGPDYIDPMFHSKAIGARSRNLDPFFTGKDLLCYLFARSAEGSDISVIEGAMGFYDGSRMDSSEDSSCDVSRRTGTPVIIIIDGSGSSLSAMAVLKGMLEFEDNNIRGVIFNRMSEGVYRELRPLVERMGVIPVGYVPKIEGAVLESRHLGLVLPSEISDIREKLDRIADVLETTLDIDSVISIARSAPELQYAVPSVPKMEPVRIGLADDDAFCFTYGDNIQLLMEMGAEIVPFSPLSDPALPDVDLLILSGGYPELYAERLSSNASMREDIRKKIVSGLPCVAECGGFMYLHDTMEGSDGKVYEMCHIIPGATVNEHRLVRFGYVTLTSDRLDIGPVRGHEFHHWDSDNCGSDWTAENRRGKRYSCIHDDGRIIAGYPHFYYYSNISFAAEIMRRASAYKRSV